MRVAILQTDSVRDEFRPSHGDYPDMFTTLFEDASSAEDSATDIVTATFDVRAGEYPELQAHDGYVITGSRHSVYDAIDWLPRLGAFVERAASADCRIVGVCFGHQLLAQLFGGRVEKMGWIVGVQAADILHHEPWMVPAVGEVRLLASHQDQVVALPPGASVFAGERQGTLRRIHAGRADSYNSGTSGVHERLCTSVD